MLVDSLVVEDMDVLELFELVGTELELVTELVALSSSTGYVVDRVCDWEER